MSESSPIALVDNTSPTQPANDEQDSRPSARGTHSLSKKFTRESVREGLARRKYAKWRRYQFSDDANDAPLGRDASDASRHQSAGRARSLSRGRSREPTEDIDTERSNDRRTSPASLCSETMQLSEIDILYENQRGWWFFGIPLYSAKSLLNFDPSPWITRDFEDSPVNITNAQVPDPSWEWAWKIWYIDMSYDVDEEGWQYSFAFASRFSWHGSHPWFHSFVRRRRWLRERVKSSAIARQGTEDIVVDDDHSTSHASAIRGGGSNVSPGRASAGYLSRVTTRQESAEAALPPHQVRDILTLMDELRNATVDRERIDAIKQFIDQGGEELFHLPEQITEIMSIFIFQTSRGQLLDLLLEAINSIPKNPPDEETEKKRDSLISTVTAAEDYLSELEWWIDNRHVSSPERILFNDTAESPAGPSGMGHQHSQTDGSSAAFEIKGIPEAAHVGVDDRHIR